MTNEIFLKYYNKGTALLGFIVVLFLFFLNIGVYSSLNKRPQGMHQWAQCDRASVALNFYQQSMNIFLPHTHNIANGTGITGMEFPAMNWAAAALYKLFGFNELYYRLLMLILFALALVFAFNMAMHFTGDRFFYALFSVLLFCASPVLCFYSANFIPDIASLSLSIIAWAIFFKNDFSKAKTFVLFTIVISLASLIKITSLITVISIITVSAYAAFIVKDESKLKFLKIAGAAVVAFVLTNLWYSYASYLNQKYGSGIFTLKSYPVKSLAEFESLFNNLSNGMIKEYYAYGFQWLLLIINVLIVIFIKRADKKLVLATVMLYCGGISFFILMGNQFREHDYYIITLLIAVLFNLILFFNVLHSVLKTKFIVTAFTVVLFAGFTNYMMVFCKKNYHNRFAKANWHYDTVADRYFEMEPCIDELGVSANKTVVFYADPSPQISLYLFNRKGVTVGRDNISSVALYAEQRKFDYLFIDNPVYLSQPALQPYIKNKVGQCNGISIFKLHD